MLDAIQVCGRWISTRVLEGFSRLARQEAPPSRAKFVADFCQVAGWLDAKGRPCVSTASAGLARLEEKGLLSMPPRQGRGARSSRRVLVDDGEPLPPLPQLPKSVGEIPGFRLTLVENYQHPRHPVWNRLIVREHPLGSSPLVGAQLRYLVECDSGVIGAFGFGPPAFHLACRDLWIGWSPQAMAAWRPRVIGLSRFLIRPGLKKCENLASRCYGMVLRRVAGDWEERYGLRPVLVETYVDAQTHQGRSLAASNWRRLGQSSGRGRNAPRRQKSKSIKDVWVYELEPSARARLQRPPLEQIVPRSVFAAEPGGDWVQVESDGLEVGHQTLARRTRLMLAGRWACPGASFYASFGGGAGGKAAYRWVESDRRELSFESVLRPHQKQTARRMAAEKVVLLAQDTTVLNHSGLERTEGLGPTDAADTQGLLLHTMLAFRLDGIPLGVAWAEVWARPQTGEAAPRGELPPEDKESARWLRAHQAAAERAAQMPRTILVVCGDREADMFPLYDQGAAAPPNLRMLVRAQHDRLLAGGQRLWDHLAAQPLGETVEVVVPRRQNQPSRRARLEIRWDEVEITPPTGALNQTWPNLKMRAVMAREVAAPGSAEPIEWVLLTNWPVTSAKMARRVVKWDGLRWGIECWHRVLKVGFGVEKRQLRTARALTRSLALDMIVAFRALLMTRLGRDHPDLPASVVYTDQEAQMIEILKKNSR
jgi:hypothetical protein